MAVTLRCVVGIMICGIVYTLITGMCAYGIVVHVCVCASGSTYGCCMQMRGAHAYLQVHTHTGTHTLLLSIHAQAHTHHADAPRTHTHIRTRTHMLLLLLELIGPYIVGVPALLVPLFWNPGSQAEFWMHFTIATTVIVYVHVCAAQWCDWTTYCFISLSHPCPLSLLSHSFSFMLCFFLF